jgi:hypothetical protein
VSEEQIANVTEEGFAVGSVAKGDFILVKLVIVYKSCFTNVHCVGIAIVCIEVTRAVESAHKSSDPTPQFLNL